ncbi:hypothetical protein B0T14DRAFT_569348 [Immersiella caudata]|uniref:Uncharacterized protein n=1 Tax=Immersiella caudata TaxID=314043 RepID=A0AA40BTQ0_9PEZI|nr:hypothetical protein B0T14DRAFT_569348 [Immersiella caudata]
MAKLLSLISILIHLSLLDLSNGDTIPIPSLPNGSCEIAYRPIPNSCPSLGLWTEEGDARYKICARNGCIPYLAGDLIPTWGCKQYEGAPLCQNPFFLDPRLCEPYVACKCDEGWKMIDGECKKMVCPYRNGDGRPQYVDGEKWEWKIIKGRVTAECFQGKTWCNADCEPGYLTEDPGCWSLGCFWFLP